MNSDKKSTRWVDRVWTEVIKVLSTPQDTRINRDDALYILLLQLSFAAGIVVSWQRWGNPLVDSGRELNVPLRMANGESLYSGIGYFYGPLSPYLNEFLCRIFRPTLWLFWGRGMVSTILILALVYWLARQMMGRPLSTLACLGVTWVCALKPQGSFILPYVYSLLDGGMLVLMATACLIISFRKQSRSWFFASGVITACAILAKTEFGAAAIATGIAAAALAGYPRLRSILIHLVLFLVPSITIPAFVYGMFATKLGWNTLAVQNHLFYGHVPRQILFYNGYRFGFSHPWHSLGLMVTSLVQVTAFGGLVASICLLLERDEAGIAQAPDRPARNRALPIQILVTCLAAVAVTGLVLKDLGPFLCMPFILIAICIAGIFAFLRARGNSASNEAIQAGTIIILAVSALASLTRMILRVSTGGALSSFLLPGAMLFFIYFWIVILPLFLPDSPSRLYARRMISVILCIAVSVTAITLSVRYRRKFSYPLVTSRGTWFTSPDLGVAFAQAYNFIKRNTAPGDPVAVIPEGTSLLFFSNRRNPLREEIIIPGFLDLAGEEQTIDALRNSRTALILVANRTTPEYGENAFGVDYNRRLMSWIEQTYQVCGVFGSNVGPNPEMGSRTFFIRAYCLPPPVSIQTSSP